MTSFDGDEVAAVLAAALLGMEDDQALTVEVHMPDGLRRTIERAWYEPPTGTLILDLAGVAPRVRPSANWTERYVDELYASLTRPVRTGGLPLRTVRRRGAQVTNPEPTSE